MEPIPIRQILRQGAQGATEDKAIGSADEPSSPQKLRWEDKSRWVIRPPEENQFLRIWESFCGILLVFVCFATPYEVAFVNTVLDTTSALFIINRVIDTVFTIDMTLQFFVMVVVKNRFGITYIFDQRLIVKRYIKSWFFVDFVSVTPFELIGLLFRSNDVSRLRFLRIIRLLKLLKLARLLRGMHIFRRWEVELGMSYRKLTLLQFFIGIVVAAHWTSCGLAVMSALQLESMCDTINGSPARCVDTWETIGTQYKDAGYDFVLARAIYAWHTAVTIIVHPHNGSPSSKTEGILCIVLLFIGGFIWTSVISRSTAIRTSADRHQLSYQQTVDDSNAITSDLGVSPSLRRKLRQFFLNTTDHSQRLTWIQLEKHMSHGLRSEVSYELNRGWWRRVPYLSRCTRDLRVAFSESLCTVMFCKGERFGVPFTMYILNRGLVTKGERLSMCFSGTVWGEDHLLLNLWWLLEPNTALALTFSELLTLSRETFVNVVQEHPDNIPYLRKAYLRLLLRKGLLYEVKQRRGSTDEMVTFGKQKSEAEKKASDLIKIRMSDTEMVTSPFSSPVGSQTEAARACRSAKGSLIEAATASSSDQTSVPCNVQSGNVNALSVIGSEKVKQDKQQDFSHGGKPQEMFFWAAVEDRVEQCMARLHGQILSRFEEQGRQLEKKYEEIIDSFPIPSDIQATEKTTTTKAFGACGAVFKCHQSGPAVCTAAPAISLPSSMCRLPPRDAPPANSTSVISFSVFDGNAK